MTKIIRYLWSTFLLTFPFSIRFLIYEDASYRFGNFNPWVSGFVYLPEVLLLLVFCLWFISKLKTKNYKLKINARWLWVIFGLFALNAFIVALIKGDSFLGAMFILRLFEVLVVMWLIIDKILKPKQVIILLLCGAFLQIIWGFMQFQLNHSLGLTFLGESIIGPDVLGVAKTNLDGGIKQIRAYGTFLHPNIFAGYLLVILFLSLKYLKNLHKIFLLAMIACGIYLTGSRAAMLVGLIGIIIYILEGQKFASLRFFRSQIGNKTIALVVALALVIGNAWFFVNSHAVKTSDNSFNERLSQNVISKNMVKAQPLGVGVRNFTLGMEFYSYGGSNRGIQSGDPIGVNQSPIGSPTDHQRITNRKLSPWEFQPVHNTYFLILNEVGIQGLLLLVAFLTILISRHWKTGKVIPPLILLALAPFDHFLWDSFVGMMLVGLVAGFSYLNHDSHDCFTVCQR